MPKEIKYFAIFLFILTTIFALSCTGIIKPDNTPVQSPEIEWQRTVGSGRYAYASSVYQTSDGGYIIGGSRNLKAFLIKTDSTGNNLWEKELTNENNTIIKSVKQTSDSGYIICGSMLVGSSVQESFLLLIKTDEKGNKIWGKKLDGKQYGNIKYLGATAVREITGEGYIICGHRGDNMILMKTDLEGNIIFDMNYRDRTQKEYTFSSGKDVRQTSDSGFILCGSSVGMDYRTRNIKLTKVDVKGKELWHKIYDDKQYEKGHAIWQTQDGGYILYVTGVPEGEMDEKSNGIWIIKTDKNGNELWNNFVNYGIAEGTDSTDDGGFIICSHNRFSPVESWLIKSDSQGNKLWDIEVKDDNDIYILSVRQAADGGYIACGEINFEGDNSDILLLKIAPEKKKSFSLFN